MSDVSNWIPSSFSKGTDVEGGDSVGTVLPPETPPPVINDPQSDDLSFDQISRQKLSLTPQVTGVSSHERLSPRGAPGVPVFEEDTRSSWTVETSKITPVKETVVDETSQNSFGSQKGGVKRRYSDDEPDVITFPPENVFEYMWPTEKGEFYFLQEQISDYLSVKSFKRKYPDLQRRAVDIDEKQFLRDRGVVTETQCDLGLTALRSDDVMELMNRDYPDKYRDYIRVLREKERQNMSEKHKEHTSTAADKNKMAECLKKAIKSASEYNAHLNQERKEERRSCFDLQTYTVHYPIGRNKLKSQMTKMGKYPVALLPGQFQDHYKAYTPEELRYLPVNTVMYGPLQEIKHIIPLSDGSHSDSEDSTASDGSCSSSQGTHDDGSGESTSGSEKNTKPQNNTAVTTTTTTTITTDKSSTSKTQTPYKPKDKPNALCKACKLGSGSGKDEKKEPLLHCSQCESSGHPTCLELTLGMVEVLKTYPWQCMDCKNCSHCRDPYDEDKMLFCDNCDRGYHTFCVGLKSLPQGKWICQLCGRCANCGATKPGPESSKAQWQYDISSGEKTEPTHRPQIVCQACFKRKR